MASHNSRMAQTTQWLQAIQSCMRKVTGEVENINGVWLIITIQSKGYRDGIKKKQDRDEV